MKKVHTFNRKEKTLIFSVCVGIAVALIISTILSIGLAFLVQNGKMEENEIIGVFLIRVVAVFVGVLVAATTSANKLLPITGIIATGYLFVLLVVAILFFDGTIKQIWSGVSSVVIGAAVALVIKLKPKTIRNKSLRLKK